MASFLFLALFLPSTYAAPEAPQGLSKALKELSPERFCTVKMDRTFVSTLLLTQKSSSAIFYAHKEKFRFDVSDESKNSLLFDGATYWVLEFSDPDQKKPDQVSRSKVATNSGSLVFQDLFDPKRLEGSFAVAGPKTVDKGLKRYDLTPKATQNALNITRLEVLTKASRLHQIKYYDDMENEVTLLIQSIKCQSQPKKNLFIYKPEAGVSVIDL